jgi:diguanylate cyclase (GGDEF)-like protein
MLPNEIKTTPEHETPQAAEPGIVGDFTPAPHDGEGQHLGRDDSNEPWLPVDAPHGPDYAKGRKTLVPVFDPETRAPVEAPRPKGVIGRVAGIIGGVVVGKSNFVQEPDYRRVARDALAILPTVKRAGELQGNSMYDPLTEVYRPAAFTDNLQRLNNLRQERHIGAPLGVMFMDLDGFKQVNDELGHGVGDIVLQNFADVVKEVLRGTDPVGRRGGDEFEAAMLFVPAEEIPPETEQHINSAEADTDEDKPAEYIVHPVTQEQASEVMELREQQIGDMFNERLKHLSNEHPKLAHLSVGVSIGSVFVSESESIEDAVARADKVMYEIKKKHHEADASLNRK